MKIQLFLVNSEDCLEKKDLHIAYHQYLRIHRWFSTILKTSNKSA